MDDTMSVEAYVQERCYLADEDEENKQFHTVVRCGGWQGWHCEGSLLRSLFGLLMWDVVYCDMPDVFQTPYQDAPLDLRFPSFSRKR